MQVIIDSLSRNGTTLLAAILNSHNESVCYRGFFHEPLALFGYDLDWADGLIKKDLIPVEKKIDYTEKNFQILNSLSRNKLGFFIRPYIYSLRCNKATIDLKKLAKKSINRIQRNSQYQKFSLEEWQEYINRFLINDNSVSPHQRIDELLEFIRKEHGVDVSCWRWNNAVCYFYQWIKRPEHLWLQITRNPVQSAISRKKIWGTPVKLSIERSMRYAMAYENISENPSFLNIYFEDLIDPNNNEVLINIKSFLQLNGGISRDNLVGQDGKVYRKETSELNKRKMGVISGKIEPNLASKYQSDPEYKKIFNEYYRLVGESKLYSKYFV